MAAIIAIVYMLITGDFPGAHILGVTEDDPLVDAILTVREFITGR